MDKSLFGIITCNYNRPNILDLWGASMDRLRKDIGINFPAICMSEKEDAAICYKHNIIHVIHENKPVSRKFNKAMLMMKDLNVDYVIILGSDDIMASDTLKEIFEMMKVGYDLIGVNSIYFFATNTMFKGELRLLHGTKMLGVGKTISSSVLDKIGWKPWGVDKNWGLDAMVNQTVMQHVKSQKLLSFTKIVDVKSNINLNKATFWMNKLKDKRDPNEFYSFLSEGEKRILEKIMQ